MPAVGAAIAAFSVSATAAVSAFMATTWGSLLTSVAFSALSTALQRATAKKQRSPGISTEYTTDGGARPQGFTLGWSATGGHMICPPMSHGKAGGKQNAFLTYVIDLGDVPGQTLKKLWIDEREVSFASASASQPVGGAPPAGQTAEWYAVQGLDPANPSAGLARADYGRPATGDHEGRVWLRYYDGSQSAADPFLLQVYGEGTAWALRSGRPWTADMVGVGTCYAIVTFRFDQKLFSSLPRVRFEMGGIPLYDPRKDSTVGGSGPQRAASPATWTASTNAAVIAYNILRGIAIAGGPAWGFGVPDSDLPLSAWAVEMTACDADTSGLPRWQAGLEVSVDSEPADVLEEILKASAGQRQCRLGQRHDGGAVARCRCRQRHRRRKQRHHRRDQGRRGRQQRRRRAGQLGQCKGQRPAAAAAGDRRRRHPVIVAAAYALGLSEAALDAIFGIGAP